jgi:hypothetical protein
MNDKSKTGLEILQAAVLLGVLGDVLLRQTPWGLNVFLWVSVLVTAMVALVLHRKKEFWNAQTICLHGALLFFAAMFVWRDAIQLKILNTMAILGILAVLTLPALNIKMQIAGVFHYAIAAIWSAISSAFTPFLLIFDDIKWKSLPQNGWTKHLTAVLRGLAIAAPILFVFCLLFMAADAVFEGLVVDTFNLNPDTFLIHIFVIGLVSWFTAGYLRGSLFEVFTKDKGESPKPEKTPEIKKQALSVVEYERNEGDTVEIKNLTTELKLESEDSEKDDTTNKIKQYKKEKKWNWRDFDNTVLPQGFTLGVIETSIILGLINLLFLVFVIVQIPYLFGGMDLVQNTPDFKLSEYARRGFEELILVAALVLPILLLSHWLLRKDSPVNEKIYRILAGVQIGLLFVIMISATQRLMLLTGNLGYGLTTVRFYPMAFMVLLALVFIWFGLTVLRGVRQQFAWGALWLSLFMLGTLHVLNPDDFIARTNIRLMKEDRSFDAHYNLQLSDDAVPVILENLPAMNSDDQCSIRGNLLYRLETLQSENDFRSWNWSRWIAQNKLSQSIENLKTSECSENIEYEDIRY